VTRTLELHPAAEAEAEAAARYYAARNPAAAIAFTNELDDAISRVTAEPHVFLAHEFGTRRLLLRTFPFSIVFRFDEMNVLIVAVAHLLLQTRPEDYWKHVASFAVPWIGS
jgi:plasmid stabilization system protein ParE